MYYGTAEERYGTEAERALEDEEGFHAEPELDPEPIITRRAA